MLRNIKYLFWDLYRSWFSYSVLQGGSSIGTLAVSQYERPRAVALASSKYVDKTTKIITEFTRKDPFLHLKRANWVLQKVSLWSKSICVTCKLLMSVYLDIKSLYPHLKVKWNVLMCKICIARRLVVDIYPWCNANFVPFPSAGVLNYMSRSATLCQNFLVFSLFLRGSEVPHVALVPPFEEAALP